MNQNFNVFQQDGLTVAQGTVDASVRFSDASASAVISWALQQVAAAGGILNLHPGLYELIEPVAMGDRIQFIGAGSGTVLCASARFVGDALVQLPRSRRSALKNLELDGRGGLVAAGVALVGAAECAVEDVVMQGFLRWGVVMREHCGACVLRNCRAANNAEANFLATGQQAGGVLGDFVPNLLIGCFAMGGGHGYEIHRTTVLNIESCTAYQPEGHGFYIHHTSNSVLVSGCRTFQCEKSAVYVEDAHELNLSSNIFCWQREEGIVLHRVNWAAVNGNEVIDSGVRDRQGVARIGIHVLEESSGVQIVGNTIFNWGDQPPMKHGVREEADCRENIISCNHINYVTEDACVSLGAGSKVEGNVSREDAAYRNMGKPSFPDYTRDALRNYFA